MPRNLRDAELESQVEMQGRPVHSRSRWKKSASISRCVGPSAERSLNLPDVLLPWRRRSETSSSSARRTVAGWGL
jgi:hypothetical protein